MFDSISFDTQNYSVVKMLIPNPCNIYISLNQKDERMFLSSDKIHKFSYSRLMVAQVTSEGLKFVGGEFKQDQILTIEANLVDGEYLILVEMEWMQDIYRNIVISRKKNR